MFAFVISPQNRHHAGAKTVSVDARMVVQNEDLVQIVKDISY